jgi:hypothetical protein
MNSKRNKDSEILVHLAAGCTSGEAARRASVSRRTVCRRLASDPLFREQLNNLRANLLDQAIAGLEEATGAAVQTLVDLLNSATDTVRLQSARTILDLSLAARKIDQTQTAPQDTQPRPEDRKQWFASLAAQGFFANEPAFPALWEKLQAEEVRAQADPAFHELPSDYLPRLSLEERLTSWRRQRFKDLAQIEFELLHLVRKVLERTETQLPPVS